MGCCVVTGNVVSQQGWGCDRAALCWDRDLMSRQGWLHVGLVPYRDMTFCLVTVGLQCGTEVCRDRGFPVTKSLSLGVAR